MLKNDGIHINKQEFIKMDGYQKLMNKLITREKQHAGKAHFMACCVKKAFRIEKNDIIFPRIFEKELKIKITDERIIENRVCDVELKTELYDYQKVVIDYIYEKFQEDEKVVYLKMDTGLGKSRVALGLFGEMKEPMIVIVPTVAIADQWIEECNKMFSDVKIDVYNNVKNSYINSKTHDIVICIINTFRKKDCEFLNGFGLIVFDEAHELHSVCNSCALWISQGVKCILGMSATPLERMDGLDMFVTSFLGMPIDAKDIEGFDISNVAFKAVVKMIYYEGNPDNCNIATNPSGTMSAILTIKNIIEDKERLKIIANEVSKLDGHGIFVFAELREFLPELKKAIEEKTGENSVYTPEISMLLGGVKKEDVTRAKECGKHIVLTTYGFSRRGISLPEMTALVLATPRRNGMIQIIGRILRRGSDESIVRKIIDIVDVNSGLRGQSSNRIKVYKEKGYNIQKELMHY